MRQRAGAIVNLALTAMSLQHFVRLIHEALDLGYALAESRLAFFNFAGLLFATSGPSLGVRHSDALANLTESPQASCTAAFPLSSECPLWVESGRSRSAVAGGVIA